MPKHVLAICFDCGDTIIDEGTEVKIENDIAIRAELIPGADTLLHELKRRGYPLALIADGPPETFRNVLDQHGLYQLFDAYAISGEVGVSKPNARMFDYALTQLGIVRADYGRVVMIGNALARDIKGANELGIISVWLDWAPRRSKIPSDDSEIPGYTIHTPMEFLPLIEYLDTPSE